MGKKKETFFERLTRKNAQQADSQNPKSKKSKNWKFWLISSLLVGAVTAGITIPLVANSVIKNYNDPIKDDTVIFEFTSPGENGKKIEFKMKDLKSSELIDDAKDPKKVLQQAFRLALFYLYEQEVKASKEYQRLWNASRKDDDKERSDIALKSVSELKQKHRDLLLDVQQQMIKTYGFSKWEQAFNDLLIKSFDGAKNIEEAADFRVFAEIRNDALRRFNLNTQFNIKDIDRTANNDIYKLDDKGEPTSEILFRAGEKVFPFFQKDVNYFELDQIKEKMTFMTNSFVVSTATNPKEYNQAYKNASAFIEHYLKQNNPVLISQFTLPGVAPAKKEASTETKWTIDKSAFKKLMFYWPVETDSNFQAISSFDKVKTGFKSYEEYAEQAAKDTSTTLNKDITNYSTVLATLGLDSAEVKSNWGSNGLNSLGNLLKAGGDDTLKAFSTLDKLILGETEQLKEVDLFGKLEEIKNKIVEYLSIQDPKSSISSSTNKNEAQTKLADFNKAIKKAFDEASDVKKEGLYTEKFNELVAKPLTQLFEQDGKIQTVYKLKGSDDTRIILSSTGITLVKVSDLASFKKDNKTSEQVIKDMIKNDFLLSNKYKNSVNGKKYNALSLINTSMSAPELVLNSLIDDANFIKYLKEQNNIYALNEQGALASDAKYADKDIADIKTMNQNVVLASDTRSTLELTKAIDKWIKERAEAGYDANFELKEGKVYFKHNNSSYSKDASSLIFEQLNKLRKAGE
ncbi:HinT-interacting membrane complex protein P80 [Mycoplasma simbae]|uniref:HinT-interacting membrane complex protein P80 n=1 Tax=Mycoplasma simbae TaxID=36744 RepID=UPI00049641FE|nr:hypothetical protein [Mycoplasma simbae]